jgi:hypothetical protein
MERIGMEIWENYLNKKILLFYNDGSKITPKSGILLRFDHNFVFLQTERKIEGIPISRIVRVEIPPSEDLKKFGGERK